MFLKVAEQTEIQGYRSENPNELFFFPAPEYIFKSIYAITYKYMCVSY